MLRKHLRRKLRTFEETQISNIIRKAKGKTLLLLKFHQFYAKNPEGIPINLKNNSSPTGNNRKPIFLNRKPLKNRKLRKKFSKIFLMKVSGKSHSAENLEQCFMLAKRVVSSKNRGGFDENKLEKKSHRKNSGLFKKTKIGYSVLSLKKPNFKTKIIRFEKSHNAENCKRGHFEIFLTSILLQNTKNERGHFGDIERICEKKVSQSRNDIHKKFWSRARLEPTSFCLADLKKS